MSQPQTEPARRSGVKVTRIGRVVLGSLFVLGVVLLLCMIQQSREAARRTYSRNNLRQIGLALENYHETFAMVPPASITQLPDQQYHGWPIMMLPFLEASPHYNMVDFHRPWNSPVNSPSFRTQIPSLSNPDVSQTTDSEGYALSHYAGSSKLFGVNSSVSLKRLEAGIANTVLVGEVGQNYQAWGGQEIPAIHECR